MKRKILLDHRLDWRLGRYLPGHDVVTARDKGWDRVKNGALLSLCEDESFEVFVTADQNLRHQQNLSGRTISIIVLVTRRNVLASLIPLAPKVLDALEISSARLWKSQNRSTKGPAGSVTAAPKKKVR